MCSSSSLIHCFVFLKQPGQMVAGGGGGVIVFSIFHHSVSTDRGRLEDEAFCRGIVWFTLEATSQ